MIPIYRAKKVDTDEWVEGTYIPKYWLEGIGFMDKVILEDTGYHRDVHYIDANTLAIHFPNMIDKNGKKIFASLSEDGVGGDIVEMMKYPFKIDDINHKIWHQYEVIGIYKG